MIEEDTKLDLPVNSKRNSYDSLLGAVYVSVKLRTFSIFITGSEVEVLVNVSFPIVSSPPFNLFWINCNLTYALGIWVILTEQFILLGRSPEVYDPITAERCWICDGCLICSAGVSPQIPSI